VVFAAFSFPQIWQASNRQLALARFGSGPIRMLLLFRSMKWCLLTLLTCSGICIPTCIIYNKDRAGERQNPLLLQKCSFDLLRTKGAEDVIGGSLSMRQLMS
jgi:hypothetical protein